MNALLRISLEMENLSGRIAALEQQLNKQEEPTEPPRPEEENKREDPVEPPLCAEQ